MRIRFPPLGTRFRSQIPDVCFRAVWSLAVCSTPFPVCGPPILPKALGILSLLLVIDGLSLVYAVFLLPVSTLSAF